MAGYKNNWHLPQRQPLKSLASILLKTILGLFKVLWPFLLLLVLRRKNAEGNQNLYWLYLSIGFSVLSLLSSWVNFWYFRFYIDAGEKLVIEKGLFNKQKISIPIQNIQAIHVNKNWLHRLLNISSLLIDSPGSKGEEAMIILKDDQATELKSYIFKLKEQLDISEQSTVNDNSKISSPSHKEEILLFGIGPDELIKLGISENHIRTFFIILAFAYGLLQNLRQFSEVYYSETWRKILNVFFSDAISRFILIVLVIILVSIVVSFVRIFLRYANFKISKIENGFYVRSGMFEIKENIIGLNKIQFIKWSANWMRRRMNLYMMHFASIGGAVEKENFKIIIPVTKSAYIPVLISHYGHSLTCSQDYVKADKKYLAFKFKRYILPPALVLIFLSFWQIHLLWLLIIVIYYAISLWLFYKKAILYINDDLMHFRVGSFGTEEYLLQWRKVQSVKIRQSIYQRKHHLATILFVTATGNIAMPFISLEQAETLANIALYKIEMPADS